MTTVHSPTAGRRRLRYALRQARDLAGLTQEQVAHRMDWSLSKVIRIESGTVGISTSDLRQLLQLYQVDDSDRVTELVGLARVGRQRPWWTRYREAVPGPYLSYIGLEDECRTLRGFQPIGMHGLLQTEEYAQALLAASNAPPPFRDDRASVRLTRQQMVLQRPDPPEIALVLDEAVLWRQIGGPEVLRRQLLHLVSLGSQPRITLQVLPFTAHHVTLLSSFVILEFPDLDDPDVVYTEGAFEENRVIDDPVWVEQYRAAFEGLRAAALSKADSLEKVAEVAGQLR